MCSIFASCGQLGPDIDMLHATAAYSVPGMFNFDTVNVDIQVTEQDDYGRVLFSYTTYDVITGQEQTAWVICQKITKQAVYYYEDQNYSFSDSQDSIESLKQQNDWGAPLNEQQCSVRQPKFKMFFSTPGISSASNLKRNKIAHAIEQQYGYADTGSGFCDADGHGSELWYFVFDQEGTVLEYFVLTNSKYEINLFEIKNDTFSPEELHKFKVNCGWHFN